MGARFNSRQGRVNKRQRNLFRGSVAVLGMWIGVFMPIYSQSAERVDSGKAADFQREIRPVLSKNCISCHGPDEEDRQAGLRLDVRDSAVADRGGYRVITPGKSSESRLVERITHPTVPMPPAATGNKLTTEEIELIKKWIDEGAPYAIHWAFEEPVRPALPEVKNTSWPKNAIDRFVLARLESEGLTPSPEADPYILVRRLYLDLIGIPPTPEQADAFIKDDKPDAYERLVHELMNSPRYGERWARVWLDLARYADSKGYESDGLRTIWPFRDWVIRALNQNMPFDRFTLEQIAGDLLPVPTQEQLIATGFHRNTMTNSEGGTDDEEFRDAALRDRVATTMQVWMGITAGCAQCHSHKYDPLTHREFYQLYAFFDQSEDSDKNDDRPFIEVGDATTLIMRELPPDKRRTTHILERGNFLTKGEEVSPVVPKAFHPLPKGAPANRLGLAKWLTDRENPLTARVTVNRFWARLFGAGLVESEEDFGTQGMPPSHPQLLDWLATEFMRLDWDVKAIQKLMVMSATYRQSSDVSAELLEKDKYNRLLARGPRVRLEAEMVRDQALVVSGLLSKKMYGPPVMPLQPEGFWQAIYSSARWITSEGEDRYRRGFYTMWRRTSPYPSMMTFDATSGEICTLRRVRTNTPLQALVTLNDPAYVEVAKELGRLVVEEGGESVEDRARYAFRRCLVRPPSADELDRAVAMYQEALRHFEADTAAARKLTHIDRSVYFDESRMVTLMSDARTAAPKWRYTVEKPAADWTQPRYGDAEWSEGSGVFGWRKKVEKEEGEENREERNEKKKPEESYATEWSTSDVWMRHTFRIPEKKLGEFQLKIRYRGNFEVYINGVKAAEGEEASERYREFPLSKAAQESLRGDDNVIAVHCYNPGEEDDTRYLDVGLTALRPLPPIPPRPDDAERAAWMTLSNVLLNLDETLTKR